MALTTEEEEAIVRSYTNEKMPRTVTAEVDKQDLIDAMTKMDNFLTNNASDFYTFIGPPLTPTQKWSLLAHVIKEKQKGLFKD